MKTLLFDTHAHLDDVKFDADREVVIQKIIDSGVGRVVNIGSDMESSKRSIQLAEKYNFIYAAVGVHPHDAENMTDDDLLTIEKWVAHPKVVAIGEIGLDYFYDNSPRDVQRYWFEKQLLLAEKLDKPVIIHDRDAHGDTLDILGKSKAKGILHCFSGSVEMAKQIVNMGFYISFAGPLTYKNSRHSVEVARAIPIDKILIETDCPYLAPDGYRGERNDSSLVRLVCEKLAEIKDISFDEAARITYQNAERVYRLDNNL